MTHPCARRRADRALRSAINDPVAVEADSTARIIAALKKVSKSKPVVLLDANASLAKQVARRLSALGFRNVYVAEGGFDGRGGWVSSGLSVLRESSVGNSNARSFGGLPIPGTTSSRK
jgi:rhodanese-related sulfurtransferase